MDNCTHVLVSLGQLARDNVLGTNLALGDNASHMVFGDGQLAPIVNLGVLIIPTVGADWSARAGGFAALHGAYPSIPPVTQGNRTNSKISERVLHCRGNHRATAVINDWHKCSNAPAAWRLKNVPCDDCMIGKADNVPSDHHMPKVTAAGDLLSFDVYDIGVPHIHGGQRKVLGIHDHFSTLNWVRLLKNETEDELTTAWREFLNYTRSVHVTIRHVHTDNAKPHVGAKMTKFFAEEVKCRYTTIVPNTPRQNGAMERQWRDMGNDTRTLMCHAKLPKNYAWYALEESVRVANTLPIKGNTSKCAHLLFTGHRPTVTTFRVWGCIWPMQKFSTHLPKCPIVPSAACILANSPTNLAIEAWTQRQES
eukprot:1224635-Prymnesium_polylepis.1